MAEKILMGQITRKDLDGIIDKMKGILIEHGKAFDSITYNRWGIEIDARLDWKKEHIDITVCRKELEMQKYKLEEFKHKLKKRKK